MVGLTIAVLGVGVAGGVLSPSLVLDVVATWPLGVPAVPALAVAVVLRSRRPKLMALPALFVVTWLFATVGLHLGGWAALPSAAADRVGPATTGVARTTLTLSSPGGSVEIVGHPGDPLFRVAALRRGGDTPPPAVGVASRGRIAEVVVAPAGTDNPWYRFGGWLVELSDRVTWDIHATGPSIVADFRAVRVGEASLTGGGTVKLGHGRGRLLLDGSFRVEVPDDVGVSVEGEAEVPSGWTTTELGYTSPGGVGWTVVVSGSVTFVRVPGA
jgi:hypothetical protein